MKGNEVLVVDQISKQYALSKEGHQSSFLESLASNFKKKTGPGERIEGDKWFWALRDISFTLEKGDVLGVIGRNGSGKSTLLKVLSGITPPTKGQFSYSGVMSSILEIGTGFHGDLSGRDNIFLNSAILGLSKQEVEDQMDHIVEFSGLRDFLDLPVKHYSSGMYLRLAFSIAFHSNVDILLLDEVISVGDAEFSIKSKEKVQQLINQGATLIIVSHSMNEIAHLCNKCMLLDKGEMKEFGNPSEIVFQHLSNSLELVDQANKKEEEEEGENDGEPAEEVVLNEKAWTYEEAPEGENVRLHKIQIYGKGKEVGADIIRDEEVIFDIYFWKEKEDDYYGITMNIFDRFFNPVLESAMMSNKHKVSYFNTFNDKTGLFRCRCHLPPNHLMAGMYSMNLMIVKNESVVVLSYLNSVNFTIHPVPGSDPKQNMSPFAMSPDYPWDMNLIEEIGEKQTHLIGSKEGKEKPV